MNSYPWFIDNWKASEHRARLSPLARCVYRELIDSCWQYGSIPQDAKTLASLSAVTLKQFNTAWVEIESLFVSKNDRYHHPTVDRKRSQFIESKEKLSDAGKKGAAKRYSQATGHPTSRNDHAEASGLATGHPTSRDPNGLANGLAIAPTSYILPPTERGAVVEAQKQTREAAPAPAPELPQGPDPDEAFAAAARMACESLPAGGDPAMTKQAIITAYQSSASFLGRPAEFADSLCLSIRKWRIAYDQNPHLRPKPAQWWIRDGTYAISPPKPQPPKKRSLADLDKGGPDPYANSAK